VLRRFCTISGAGGVSSEIWDRPGPLGPADLERVRLHPYWTERILGRCAALSPLADIAAAHHERLDGSGYHRPRPCVNDRAPDGRGRENVRPSRENAGC
jgi:hypothetical protein